MACKGPDADQEKMYLYGGTREAHLRHRWPWWLKHSEHSGGLWHHKVTIAISFMNEGNFGDRLLFDKDKLDWGLHSHLFSQYAFLGTYTCHVGDFFCLGLLWTNLFRDRKEEGRSADQAIRTDLRRAVNTRRTYRQIFGLVSWDVGFLREFTWQFSNNDEVHILNVRGPLASPSWEEYLSEKSAKAYSQTKCYLPMLSYYPGQVKSQLVFRFCGNRSFDVAS